MSSKIVFLGIKGCILLSEWKGSRPLQKLHVARLLQIPHTLDFV
jgi:hypothetical protein